MKNIIEELEEHREDLLLTYDDLNQIGSIDLAIKVQIAIRAIDIIIAKLQQDVHETNSINMTKESEVL